MEIKVSHRSERTHLMTMKQFSPYVQWHTGSGDTRFEMSAAVREIDETQWQLEDAVSRKYPFVPILEFARVVGKMGYDVEIVLDGKTYIFNKDTSAPPLAYGQSGIDDEYDGWSDPEYSDPSDATDDWSDPEYSDPGDATDDWSDPEYSDPGDETDDWSDPEYSDPSDETDGWSAPEYSDPSDETDDWSDPGHYEYSNPIANPKYEFVYNAQLGIMQYDIPELWESGELIEDWREGPTSLWEPMTESEVTGGVLTGTYAAFYNYTPYQIILVLNEDNVTGYWKELDPAWPAHPYTYRYIMQEEHPMFDNVYNGMIFTKDNAGESNNEFVVVSPTVLYAPGFEAIFYRID
jgi:hypothetical protein